MRFLPRGVSKILISSPSHSRTVLPVKCRSIREVSDQLGSQVNLGSIEDFHERFLISLSHHISRSTINRYQIGNLSHILTGKESVEDMTGALFSASHCTPLKQFRKVPSISDVLRRM